MTDSCNTVSVLFGCFPTCWCLFLCFFQQKTRTTKDRLKKDQNTSSRLAFLVGVLLVLTQFHMWGLVYVWRSARDTPYVQWRGEVKTQNTALHGGFSDTTGQQQAHKKTEHVRKEKQTQPTQIHWKTVVVCLHAMTQGMQWHKEKGALWRDHDFRF